MKIAKLINRVAQGRLQTELEAASHRTFNDAEKKWILNRIRDELRDLWKRTPAPNRKKLRTALEREAYAGSRV